MPHASHNFTEPTAAEPLAGGCTGCGALPGDAEAATPCERPRAFKAAPRLVILESPYAAPTDAGRKLHVAYARAAMRDCLLKNEAPFASYAIYTQPCVLRDSDPIEREIGIDAGLAWGRKAAATVVYDDLGVSSGMATGMRRARSEGRPVEHRQLPGWQPFAALPTEPRDKIIANPRDFATWLRLASDAERLCGRDVAGRVLREMLAASPAHARNVAVELVSAAMGIAAQSKPVQVIDDAPAVKHHRTICAAYHAQRKALAGDAKTVDTMCTWCGAKPGEPCTRTALHESRTSLTDACSWCFAAANLPCVDITNAEHDRAAILDAATKAIASGRAGIYLNEARAACGGGVSLAATKAIADAMLADGSLVAARRTKALGRIVYAPGKPVAAPAPAAAPPQATAPASATKATPGATVAGWYDWPSSSAIGSNEATDMHAAHVARDQGARVTIDGRKLRVAQVAHGLTNGKVRVRCVPWRETATKGKAAS